MRSARIRIWPADSSPDRYSARRPLSAQRWVTSSSRVDSLTPVRWCRVAPGSMELIGTAGVVGTTDRLVADPLTAASTATSSTVPQVPQSGQRPTHFAVTWWHSEQRYCERALATV